MNQFSRVVLASAIASSCLWPAVVETQSIAVGVCRDPTGSTDDGRVYDIDFGGVAGGATQVLIDYQAPRHGPSPLVTSVAAIQNLLQSSLLLKHVVVVHGGGQTVPRITLAVLRDRSWQGEGRVTCMACEEMGGCAAALRHKGKDVVLTTGNARAQGVLFTAVAHETPVDPETLVYDARNVIMRVKINVPVK